MPEGVGEYLSACLVVQSPRVIQLFFCHTILFSFTLVPVIWRTTIGWFLLLDFKGVSFFHYWLDFCDLPIYLIPLSVNLPLVSPLETRTLKRWTSKHSSSSNFFSLLRFRYKRSFSNIEHVYSIVPVFSWNNIEPFLLLKCDTRNIRVQDEWRLAQICHKTRTSFDKPSPYLSRIRSAPFLFLGHPSDVYYILLTHCSGTLKVPICLYINVFS